MRRENPDGSLDRFNRAGIGSALFFPVAIGAALDAPTWLLLAYGVIAVPAYMLFVFRRR